MQAGETFDKGLRIFGMAREDLTDIGKNDESDKSAQVTTGTVVGPKVAEGAAVCANAWESVPAATNQVPRFCTNCGSPLGGNVRFCSNCGSAVQR